MATTTRSTAGNAQFNHILGDFKRDLSQNEIHDFSFTSSIDLKDSICRLQEEQKSMKRMQNLRRLSAFIEAMDQFDKTVHVFLNATNYLGFIWGPAKFMLLIASSYAEALNTLLDAYQEIGEHVPLLEQYASHISNSPYLQEIVGLIYKDILSFHRKAMKHFRQRAWKKLFHATWRTFRTDFGAIISNLQSHRRLLDSQAIFLGVQEIMNVMKELHEGRQVLDAECRRRQAEDEARQQHLVISWLCAADSASDHEEALAIHEDEPESCRWLFQQKAVKEWLDPSSQSHPILWINGKPGAGKTILASSLIEHCRSQPSSAVAYFYCKHGDPRRDNFLGLARSIIFQFTRLNSLLLPFILEKQATAGTDSLRSPKDVKEILETAVESSSDLVLIFDGLDECVMPQKKEIVSWIRSAVISANANGPKSLRCCIVSQADNDMGRLLRDVATFHITEQHNNEDILRFCRRRADEIGENFGLSLQDIQNLAERVAVNADGMFLYAKLVMDNLEGQVSKAALHQEIETIPPNLNQVYKRIKHRILSESSLPEQRVAKTILSWLLCARRPLKWHEIQGAMCLNLDDDSFDCDRKLIKNIKDFCGSLIEVRKGGAICFVHLTAKYFLRDETVLPIQLEHIRLTRLCFSHLSLPSHASDNSRDSIRRYLLRGEYSFTEYSVVYAFDHLLDVLSEQNEIVKSNDEEISKTLQKFITKRVTAPKNRAAADKHVDGKLQLFKNNDIYHSLRHAITYHKQSFQRSAENADDEDVLTLLQQLGQVRSVMETTITSGSPDHLKNLYGHDLFKCSQPLCESFHTGFPTKTSRDNHENLHERIHLCLFAGCPSAMLGFSSLRALREHEQNYHKKNNSGSIFPWHGSLDTLNIVEEIEKGNYIAFELWLSQWENEIPISILADYKSDPIRAAAAYNQNKMLSKLLEKVDVNIVGRYKIRYTISSAILAGNEEGVQILLNWLRILSDKEKYGFLSRALSFHKDNIAKVVLKHPSSALQTEHRPRNQGSSYLTLAIRFGRYAIFTHLLEHYQLNPEHQDGQGRSTLIAAAEFDQIEIAKYLIEIKGCNKWPFVRKGDTPLSMAGRQGHEEFITSLYHETAETQRNAMEIQKWLRVAQLHNAARNGDYSKARELLDADALNTDEPDNQSRSPWMWAVEKNHEPIVELFLSMTNVAFDRPYRGYGGAQSRHSVIHVVALSGNNSMMRLLLQSGKFDDEMDRACDRFGRGPQNGGVSGTPLKIAKHCGYTEMVKTIEDYQSSLSSKDDKSQDAELYPPDLFHPHDLLIFDRETGWGGDVVLDDEWGFSKLLNRDL